MEHWSVHWKANIWWKKSWRDLKTLVVFESKMMFSSLKMDVKTLLLFHERKQNYMVFELSDIQIHISPFYITALKRSKHGCLPSNDTFYRINNTKYYWNSLCIFIYFILLLFECFIFTFVWEINRIQSNFLNVTFNEFFSRFPS